MSEPTIPEPSSVAWSWRERTAAAEAAHAREAASNRRKGLIGCAIGLAAAAAVHFFLHRPFAAAVITTLTVLSTLVALVSPLGAYKSLNRVLERFAHAVGLAFTWVLMTALYYLVFLPVGALLRARGKLAISRRADPRLPTYWISTEGRERTAESYRKLF
jgi:hypothetical protein